MLEKSTFVVTRRCLDPSHILSYEAPNALGLLKSAGEVLTSF